MSDDTPILKIMQYLKNAGWSVGAESKFHTASEPKRCYGTCDFVERRSYLQCLCVLPQLHDKGLDKLKVGLSASYYHCLLHADNPGSVPFKGRVDEFARICKESSTLGIKKYIAPRQSQSGSDVDDIADEHHSPSSESEDVVNGAEVDVGGSKSQAAEDSTSSSDSDSSSSSSSSTPPVTGAL